MVKNGQLWIQKNIDRSIFFPQEICGSPHYLAPELIGAFA